MQNFNRIQAFLDSSKANGIDVIAPAISNPITHKNEASSPNYGLRFLSLVSNSAGKAALAGIMSMSVMSISFADDLPKQDIQNKPIVVASSDAAVLNINATKEDLIAENKKREIQESVLRTYTQYAPNGMSSRQIQIYPDYAEKDKEKVSPKANLQLFQNDKNARCNIVGVSSSYADLLKDFPQDRIDLPSMRGFVIAHEDMHCRTSPSMFENEYVKNIFKGKSPENANIHWSDYAKINLAANYKTQLSENIADAMGAFMVAKADGKETALEEAKYWHKIREVNVNVSDDTVHDSRETLKLVMDRIKNYPAFDSDDEAFAAAIEIGLKGTNKSILNNPNEVRHFESNEFKENVKSSLVGLQQSYVDFREGLFGPKSFLLDHSSLGNLGRIIGDKLRPHPKVSKADPNGIELGKRLMEEFESTVEASKKIIPENRRIALAEEKSLAAEADNKIRDLRQSSKQKIEHPGPMDHIKKHGPSSGFLKKLSNDDAHSPKKTRNVFKP